MLYFSTRGNQAGLSAAAAVIQGISTDGGLFVPDRFPEWTVDKIADLQNMEYPQRAFRLLRDFFGDYPETRLLELVQAAYSPRRFNVPAIAPVVKLQNNLFVQELWHGPTAAFKDMALQILPRLLATALDLAHEELNVAILVATSGDTGKAALEGFRDVERTKVVVFYPEEGVSPAQKLQMMTQEGANLAVVAVKGNFDDAQSGVKKIFRDPAAAQRLAQTGWRLSSANSINWGRLAPQIVYYFSAYADLLAQGVIAAGDPVHFAVPTGNFGNILAGYYAKLMGLPIGRLICASNRNNVVADFLSTGRYDRRRDFYRTSSPSMDILISSNLERLLYHLTDRDGNEVGAWMRQLEQQGCYSVSEAVRSRLGKHFFGGWTADEQACQIIADVWRQEKYLLDPHTAVAWSVAAAFRRQAQDDRTPIVVLSTASPFKFAHSVAEALSLDVSGDEFALLDRVAKATGWTVPSALAGLSGKPVRHTRACAREEMKSVVLDILAK